MTEYVERAGLKVAVVMAEFIECEMLPGTGIESNVFWQGCAEFVNRFHDRNRALLETRQQLQAAIDDFHRMDIGSEFGEHGYLEMLLRIGYTVPEGDPFQIETSDVDEEIAETCGPQLVVPVMNARYALNAANARWGSLYDALYGTDALGSPAPKGGYDTQRGAEVIRWSKEFLDEILPIRDVSHREVDRYFVSDGQLFAQSASARHSLLDPSAFVGFHGGPDEPQGVLLRHNELHVLLKFDRNDQVGRNDRAGLVDVILESAVTTIMDFEDSVAAVDAEDKAKVYQNWLGLMKRDLRVEMEKGGEQSIRHLNPDMEFMFPDGSGSFMVPGTALMLARNVGHLMTTEAVLRNDGSEVFEGQLDLLVTAVCAIHDLRRQDGATNSRGGSVYVVKPKMHGPDEVKFAVDMMTAVEEILGLPSHTLKIGIMDEERRTSVNLMECIRAARSRVVFINTGFLDRTGDEIHTSMEAGPVVRKGEMKSARWLAAYELRNVLIGLACGFRGRAQIGKGMWAAPDLMRDMLEQKINHPRSGANCAWVPSPTAATLHATHYHRVDVRAEQDRLESLSVPDIAELLQIPLLDRSVITPEEVALEVDNSCQSILGYVVRWVDSGVGCSKVPDINNVALMEDRATCRISSQHLANWVRHDVVSIEEIENSLRRMALVVDGQNSGEADYEPMAPSFDGDAFAAALDLIRSGTEQPSGYTEPILHRRRLMRKGKK
jgi:malate synthase